jgi:hypothetical protein
MLNSQFPNWRNLTKLLTLIYLWTKCILGKLSLLALLGRFCYASWRLGFRFYLIKFQRLFRTKRLKGAARILFKHVRPYICF